MLSLSRYPYEGIYLYNKFGIAIARIQVNSRKGDQISIGIQAVDEVGIVREELLERDEPEKLSQFDRDLNFVRELSLEKRKKTRYYPEDREG